MCALILQYKHCYLPFKFKLKTKTIYFTIIQCTYILLKFLKILIYIYIYIETVPKMETFVPHVLITRCMHIVLAC